MNPKGRSVAGKNSYCGPFAVGYCAGVSPDRVSQYIRNITDRPSVRSMNAIDVNQALVRFGCTATVSMPEPEDKLTFGDWYESLSKLGLYLLFIEDHFIVIDGDRLIDNQHKTGLCLEGSILPYKHRPVILVWEITSNPQTDTKVQNQAAA